MERIGTAFRRSVSAFAEDEHIPVVHFGKDDCKIDIMRRYVAAQAATGPERAVEESRYLGRIVTSQPCLNGGSAEFVGVGALDVERGQQRKRLLAHHLLHQFEVA